MNLQYQYPEAFLLMVLLPLLVLVYFFYMRWKKKAAKRIGQPHLVAALTGNHSAKRAHFKFFLFLIAFALGLVALANPRRPDDASAEIRKGIDVVIALDVSSSMLATDVEPSRLAEAKKLLVSLVDKLRNDRVGFIVFAGNAYTQMPLSTDHEAAKLFVSTASPNMVPEQGTALGDALLQANAAFEEDSRRFKTIVLVTDGETHDEEALSTARDLSKTGVMVNTIGLGSVSGTTIIDTATGSPKVDENGAVVVSKLNEDLLQQIAAATNGVYQHLLQQQPVLAALEDQYKDVERVALPDTSGLYYESFYWWFLLPAFLLLVAELFLPERKKLSK